MLTSATRTSPDPAATSRAGKEVKSKSHPFQVFVAIIDRVRSEEDGQGLAEYALILALIAIISIVALLFMGSQISDKMHVVGTTLQNLH